MGSWLQSAFSGGAFFGHLSYILLIVSMLMSQLWLLRVLAISSGLVGVFYFAAILGDPVAGFWELLLILANLFQLLLTAWRDRVSRFTADEMVLRASVVPGLPPSDVRRLLKACAYRELPPGAILTEEGKAVTALTFLVSGAVDIRVGGATVAHCGPGQFVGEMGVANNEPATATALAATPLRCFAFEAVAFRRLLSRDRVIGQELDMAFRLGLREKLVRANQALALSSAAKRGAVQRSVDATSSCSSRHCSRLRSRRSSCGHHASTSTCSRRA
ncbi:MAG: cyclic nucleotide-binding domain-containing protein [Bauldia sp.]